MMFQIPAWTLTGELEGGLRDSELLPKHGRLDEPLSLPFAPTIARRLALMPIRPYNNIAPSPNEHSICFTNSTLPEKQYNWDGSKFGDPIHYQAVSHIRHAPLTAKAGPFYRHRLGTL